MSEQAIKREGTREASPREVHEALKRDISRHLREGAQAAMACPKVALFDYGLRHMPSDLPPAQKSQPASWAMLEVLARQVGSLCHVFESEAEATRAHLHVLIDRAFRESAAAINPQFSAAANKQ